MLPLKLKEIDSLEVAVIVTDELDPISPSPNPDVKHASHFLGIPVSDVNDPHTRGGAAVEMKMSSICCAAHGLSLMITTKCGDRGLLRAITMVNECRNQSDELVVDLHPDRPEYRGIATPHGPISLEADPTPSEVEQAGARVLLSQDAHPILDEMFVVSGEISRTTDYEAGLPGGLKFVPSSASENGGSWIKDEQILEERYVMCNVKGKGLVIFTGCGHAGVINTIRDAQRLSGVETVYCVSGGYHMSDASPEKLRRTVQDMVKLSPWVLHGGHCTGWRFKTEMEKIKPGIVVPCTVGMTYTL
ncbi:hypothetical protein CSOJ01_10315 [Colletotrichum sojae]|uniref:Metallo-beta-lactamase superfamily protein n=1 Tax=Colletotrichum sojae TaxID=2175907 RepID=A0A8H6J0J3_9PEZI|nr:hypothetical protein CSOJ01_10315 [Colletotrichum sojae]